MAAKGIVGNELPARSGHVRKSAAEAKRPDGLPNSPEESSGEPVETCSEARSWPAHATCWSWRRKCPVNDR